MKICINAGHCPGLDSGAVGATGVQEAEVSRDIGQLVTSYLQRVGYDILFVQENELYQITDASNQFGADLFVSIHCNSAVNKEAKGTETFCFSEFGDGGKLARCIQNQIISTMGTVDRGVKTDRFYVLKHTDCPAALVECAFISNADDEALLASDTGKDKFAKAIAVGISNYTAGV